MRIDRRYPPTWSAAKERLYWREWAAVVRADPRADRHALHVKALGYDQSHLEFTDLEFAKVLDVFRAIAKPVDLFSAQEASDRKKQHLIYSIRRTAQKLNIAAAASADQSIDGLEAIRLGLSRQLAAQKRTALELEVAA